MCSKDEWPYTPDCLRDFVERETLAALEAGSCERMGAPVTILDYDPKSQSFVRIESFNERQRYGPFCRILRDLDLVRGGDQACRRWDLEQATRSLAKFHRVGDPYDFFECYMGLIDVMHIVRIQDHPVAIVVSGQYLPQEGAARIRENVHKLGTGRYADTELSEPVRAQLLESLAELAPAPADIRQRLQREAEFIQRIVEAEFGLRKGQWEQEFLEQLRQISLGPGELSRGAVGAQARRMLERITEFCRCEYAVFFGSIQEGETVLAPIAQAGLPDEIAESLPHFNWKKAGFPQANHGSEQPTIARGRERAGKRGIRGDHSEYLRGASCIVPTSLGDRYMGVLVLGPTEEELDIARERRFLNDIADIVGLFALTGLEVLYLERERRRWRSTAELLNHQLRTALTPISSLTGFARALVQKGGDVDTRQVGELLKQVENMAMQVARRSRQTLQSYALQVEADDLELERHPLSVLIANCAAGFAERAQQNRLELIVDDFVEYLPEADVDVARMTIALSNLIDNAIKYSHPESKIYIRSRYDVANHDHSGSATIEIDNLGYEIAYEDQERIFEQGTRGLVAAKLGHVTGSGLGLWEARAVVDAHGGEIGVRCDRTSIRTPMGPAYKVVFAVKIPLRQPGRREEAQHA